MKSNLVLACLLSGVLLWTVTASRVATSRTGIAPPPPQPAETAYFKSLPDEEKDRALRSKKRMEGITENIRRDTKALAL